MKQKELLEHTIAFAEQVFDRVEYTSGDFEGGICRIRGERCIFLNRNASLETNLRILTTALARENLDELKPPPGVVEALLRYSER